MDFAALEGFDPLLASTPEDLPTRVLFLYFAVHLRSTRERSVKSREGTVVKRPISSTTIDQYISHVIDHLVSFEFLTNPRDARCRRLSMLLEGYAKDDNCGLPIRLTQKIPITYQVACVIYALVDKLFKSSSDRLALKAAVALAYGLSLRPGEYLRTGRTIPLRQQVNTTNCFFMFGDLPVNICDPFLFPRNQWPDDFVTMLDQTKNNRRGESGPMAVSSAPNPTSKRFCCVRTIFQYVQSFPCTRNKPLLSSHGKQVEWKDMRLLCHVAATEIGMDPPSASSHTHIVRECKLKSN